MQKLISWWDKHILKAGVLFLLFFIPLYPKLPLFDIKHTWVYIRLEDLLVAFVVLIFVIETLRRKTKINTPLSLPVVIYWFIGGVSLLNAILILQPQIANFFPTVALLHFLRRIEYMILFFVAASTIKNIKDVYHYVYTFLFMTLGVILYGFGQKFLGFPAFLTMNEEFSKGLPLYLPPEARMTSTFAGHYDLAAFLVFALAFIGSLILGFKKIYSKIILFVLFLASFILLLFTASRISFLVYLATISLMLFLHKKKYLIIPVVILSVFLMKETTGTSSRFGKTFRVESVVYDVRTGKAISTLEGFTLTPTPGLVGIGETAPIVQTPYEELPLGSGFLDVPLADKLGQNLPKIITRKGMLLASDAAHLATTSGAFLVKKSIVYDISFTTRFQGEWPRAMEAFRRNLLLGSGFSSISLATDGDYLRLLGETGLLGAFSFISIFLVFIIIIRQMLVQIKDNLVKAVIVGVAAAVFGICLNASLIDVFEASKVAYVMWIMIGLTTGIYLTFTVKKSSIVSGLIKFAQEPLTAVFVLCLTGLVAFWDVSGFYFTADDFTWLTWAATTRLDNLAKLFTDAEGFFFRPLTKLLHSVLYIFLGINPFGYHIVSLLIHVSTTILVYFIAKKLTKNWMIAFIAGLFFLIHPIHAETVFWVSGYSGLFAGFFYILSFYLFLLFKNKSLKDMTILATVKKWLSYLLSLVFYIFSMLFYEIAITLPFIIVAYLLLLEEKHKIVSEKLKQLIATLPYFISAVLYFYLRNVVAKAHFLSGDYNYSLKNLIYNFVGNLGGYFGEMLFGFRVIPFYDFLRTYLRSNKMIALGGTLFAAVLLVGVIKFRHKKIKINPLMIFAVLWFAIGLLPVLGLGNIAERYPYISSFGYVLLIGIVIKSFYDWKISSNPKAILFKNIIVLFIFILTVFFYQKEVLQAKSTWKEAGQISNDILRALPTNYRSFPDFSTLYFVNLPLRVQRAWVFPVGLDDGIWLIYRNSSLKIIKSDNLEEALNYKDANPNTYVFVFENGELKEAQRQ